VLAFLLQALEIDPAKGFVDSDIARRVVVAFCISDVSGVTSSYIALQVLRAGALEPEDIVCKPAPAVCAAFTQDERRAANVALSAVRLPSDPELSKWGYDPSALSSFLAARVACTTCLWPGPKWFNTPDCNDGYRLSFTDKQWQVCSCLPPLW
jgi:hypothetical protein